MINERFERLKYEDDQRRELDCLIHKLPGFLADFLIDAPFEYADKIHRAIGFDVFDAQHLMSEKPAMRGFSSISRWDFDDKARMLDTLLSETAGLVGRFWLRLGSGPFCKLEAEQGRYLIKGFGHLAKPIELVAEDMCSGLYTSDYSGFLDDDRRTNVDEIVYELLSWRR